MTRERIEIAILLDQESEIGLAELQRLSGLPADSLLELAQAGLLESRDPQRDAFAACGLALARTARRLRSAFELNDEGLVLALTLLRRIELLELQLRELECRLPR